MRTRFGHHCHGALFVYLEAWIRGGGVGGAIFMYRHTSSCGARLFVWSGLHLFVRVLCPKEINPPAFISRNSLILAGVSLIGPFWCKHTDLVHRGGMGILRKGK